MSTTRAKNAKPKRRRAPALPVQPEDARFTLEPADTADARLLAGAIRVTADPSDTDRKSPRRIRAEDFALHVLACDPRSLRRYLKGVRPLPPLARRECARIVEAAGFDVAAVTRGDVVPE